MHPHRDLAMLLLAVLGASLSGPGLYAQPVWNIADHGAEPARDAAPVINEGLRTQPEHGLPVYIPHGRWGVTETIYLPRRIGGALIGAGVTDTDANDSIRGLGSIIEWWGEPAEPMVRMTGSRWRVENLSLRGVPVGSDRPKASIGVQIEKSGLGIGTGKHEFRNVSIVACEVGVQCGVAPGEGNNDLLGFERLVLEECGVGYRVINSQAMSHFIDRLEARRTPVVFQFFGGGMLHARNVFAVGTTLLDLHKNDPPKFSPGKNNAVFRIENLKVDAHHAGKFCLVETHEQSHAQVILDCGMVSGPSPFTLARLGSGMQLVLRDVTSPTSAARIERAKGANVQTQNVRLEWAEQP